MISFVADNFLPAIPTEIKSKPLVYESWGILTGIALQGDPRFILFVRLDVGVPKLLSSMIILNSLGF